MTEHEALLRELGPQLEFPPTPDLASAVRDRLGERHSWGRRPLAIALAVLVVALGAVLAVPAARTAILDWLGLGGVKITRVEELPQVPARADLDLGRRVSLVEARSAAPWLLLPSDAPDRIYLSTSIPGGKVSLLWGTPTSVRLLLTEFRGRPYIEKLVEPATKVEPVQVGDRGVWLERPHVLAFLDRDGNVRESTARLARKTLIWQRGELTLRLEGELSKAEALRIARSAD